MLTQRVLRWQITLKNAEDCFNLGLNVSKLAILKCSWTGWSIKTDRYEREYCSACRNITTIKSEGIEDWMSELQLPASDLSRSSQEPRQPAAAPCWGLTGMAKSINELYCILSSPASLRMHVCMLNIWICIDIEHLLSVSQSCALNNNPAGKWTASSLPQPCNWKR